MRRLNIKQLLPINKSIDSKARAIRHIICQKTLFFTTFIATPGYRQPKPSSPSPRLRLNSQPCDIATTARAMSRLQRTTSWIRHPTCREPPSCNVKVVAWVYRSAGDVLAVIIRRYQPPLHLAPPRVPKLLRPVLRSSIATTKLQPGEAGGKTRETSDEKGRVGCRVRFTVTPGGCSDRRGDDGTAWAVEEGATSRNNDFIHSNKVIIKM